MSDAAEVVPGAEPPIGIDRDTHLLRQGHSPWPRRLVIALTAAFCLLGLLNVFGQVSAVHVADAPAASLRVDSPDRLRGGDIFTTVITMTAHRQIKDAKLRLSPDWFNGMTLNAAAPQAQQEDADQGGNVFDFGQLDAGAVMPVWISWQTNPTTLGGREQDVVLLDGDQPLVSVRRAVTVFP